MGAESDPTTDQTLIAVHQGQGSTSQFHAPQAIPTFGNTDNSAYPWIATGDLNGDGKPDIVTSGVDCNAADTSCDDRITVLLNATPASSGGGSGGGGSGGGGGGTGGGGGSGAGAGGGSGGGGAPFSGLTLRHAALTVLGNGTVKVVIPCPPSALGNCTGQAVLKSLGAIAGRVTHKRKLTFGAAPFSIPSGHTGTVTIKLSKAALRLLARKHKLEVLETVTAHDSRGISKTSSTTLTLKQPKRHRH